MFHVWFAPWQARVGQHRMEPGSEEMHHLAAPKAGYSPHSRQHAHFANCVADILARHSHHKGLLRLLVISSIVCHVDDNLPQDAGLRP